MTITLEKIKYSIENDTLKITNEKLSTDDVVEIVSFLNEYPQIKTLDLSGIPLCMDSIKVLAKMTTISSLHLHACNIHDEEATELAKNTTFKALDLKENHHIGPEGIRALAANTTLKSLDLWNIKIELEGAKALAENSTLTWLVVGNTARPGSWIGGDEGFKALASTRLQINQVTFGKSSNKVVLLKEVINNLNNFRQLQGSLYKSGQINNDKREAIEYIFLQFQKEMIEYVNNDAINLEEFKQNISKFINTEDTKNKLEILQTHRGIKKILMNLLISIASLGIALIYSVCSGNYGLFKVNTNSTNKWEDLQTSLGACNT